jgi:type I restriction enzyme M protein
VKVGKKTPMTLAHFGWGTRFETLADAALPDSLVGDWREQDGNADQPFPSFARMLHHRGSPQADSDFSWSVDFVARRTKAREEMAPHLAEVENLKAKALSLKERLAAVRKSNGTDKQLAECRDQIQLTEKAIREAQAAADAIDAATFDLKAVNPRARVESDTRTPIQILDAIAAHGRAVEAGQ